MVSRYNTSIHKSDYKEFLAEIDMNYFDNITFYDLSQTLVNGKSNIFLEHNIRKQVCISNIYYVLYTKNSILSWCYLLEKGYDIKIKNLSLSINDKNKTLISLCEND